MLRFTRILVYVKIYIYCHIILLFLCYLADCGLTMLFYLFLNLTFALITKFFFNAEVGMLIGILHYAMRVICFAVTHAEETMGKFMGCNFPDFVLVP